MVTTMKVNKAYYTFRKGGKSHIINKDLPLCSILIPTGGLVEDGDGIRSIEESSKGFPKLSVMASSVQNPTLKGEVVIYGDAIPVLLELPLNKVADGYEVIAAFVHTSNKWIVGQPANDSLEDLIKEAMALGATDKQIQKAKTADKVKELISDLS